MRAYAGIEVERPLMPGARHDVAINLTAGETPAGVWAFIVNHHNALRVGQPKHGQPETIALDERSPAAATSVQRDKFNKRHRFTHNP